MWICSALSINGIILAFFSDFNLLKVMTTLQQEFWIAFAIGEGFLLMEVFFFCQNVKKIFRQLDFSRSLLYYQLVVDIRAGSVPEFFGSGSEFDKIFGSGFSRFF